MASPTDRSDSAHFAVIVVGGGAAGSSAAYKLAKSGVKVLLIEQAQIDKGDGQALLHGSSAGESRITRLTDTDPLMTSMNLLSFEAWKDVESDCGQSLVRHTGALELGLADSPNMQRVRDAAKVAKVAICELQREEVISRWPAFDAMPKDFVGIFNEKGGILNPVKCINAFRALAHRYKARLAFGERVTEIQWHAEAKHFTLNTRSVSSDRQTCYVCDRLILAPGSWLAESLALLKPAVPVPKTKVWEISYGWYKVAEEHCRSNELSAIPVWRAHHISRCYGFPTNERPGFVKVAPHSAPEASIWKSVHQRTGQPILTEFQTTKPLISALFGTRLLTEPAGHESTCLYTVTPDERFIVGPHPAIPDGQLVVLGGFCGSGFKHAALMGELATEMILNGGCCKTIDLSVFSPARQSLYQENWRQPSALFNLSPKAKL